MADADSPIKSARVHHTANNQRLAKAILESSSQNLQTKPHHNAGRRFGKPFEKGHKAYSHGQKNPISLTSLLKDELSRVPTEEEDGFDGKGKSNAWWMIHNYVKDARLIGGPGIIKDVMDRLEGKPAQAIVGPDGGPIQIQQDTKIIDESNLNGAIEALVECKAINFNPN